MTYDDTTNTKMLKHIADIAHSGGLVDLDELDALDVIRRLTICYWDKTRTIDENRKAVAEAVGTEVSVMRWEPIETAPRDGRLVLICGKNTTKQWMQPVVCRYVGKLHADWEITCTSQPIPNSAALIWCGIPGLPV